MADRGPIDGSAAGMQDDSWASSPATRRSMQGNRRRDTRPEMAVRSAVHALGLRYLSLIHI